MMQGWPSNSKLHWSQTKGLPSGQMSHCHVIQLRSNETKSGKESQQERAACIRTLSALVISRVQLHAYSKNWQPNLNLSALFFSNRLMIKFIFWEVYKIFLFIYHHTSDNVDFRLCYVDMLLLCYIFIHLALLKKHLLYYPLFFSYLEMVVQR